MATTGWPRRTLVAAEQGEKVEIKMTVSAVTGAKVEARGNRK